MVVPLVTTPYISRVLGDTGIGTYTLAHTYANYFVLFAGFGFAAYAARELAYVRDDEDKFRSLFWEIFLAKAILIVPAVAIYIAYFFVINPSGDLSYRLCLIFLAASFFDVSYYYGAREDFKTVALRNIFVKSFALVMVFALVKRADQVWLYTLILALSEALGQVIMIASLDKKMFKNITVEPKNLKKHFAVSFALFVPTIAIQVYTALDKIMLGALSTVGQVGFYENAQKIPRLAASVASAVVAVSTPRMAYSYAEKDAGAMENVFYKVFGFVSFLAFPMCFGLIGVSRSFSAWFYGANFAGIESLVSVGAVLIISLGWSGIFGNMVLIATGNQKYFTMAVYVSAAVNIGLNAVLIRPLGAMGALAASVAAEIIGMLIMMRASDKIIRVAPALKKVPKYFIAALAMLAVIAALDKIMSPTIITTAVQMALGGAVYMLIMLITKDENLLECLGFAKKILKR